MLIVLVDSGRGCGLPEKGGGAGVTVFDGLCGGGVGRLLRGVAREEGNGGRAGSGDGEGGSIGSGDRVRVRSTTGGGTAGVFGGVSGVCPRFRLPGSDIGSPKCLESSLPYGSEWVLR